MFVTSQIRLLIPVLNQVTLLAADQEREKSTSPQSTQTQPTGPGVVQESVVERCLSLHVKPICKMSNLGLGFNYLSGVSQEQLKSSTFGLKLTVAGREGGTRRCFAG